MPPPILEEYIVAPTLRGPVVVSVLHPRSDYPRHLQVVSALDFLEHFETVETEKDLRYLRAQYHLSNRESIFRRYIDGAEHYLVNGRPELVSSSQKHIQPTLFRGNILRTRNGSRAPQTNAIDVLDYYKNFRWMPEDLLPAFQRQYPYLGTVERVRVRIGKFGEDGRPVNLLEQLQFPEGLIKPLL
jgi:hypothetical protein